MTTPPDARRALLGAALGFLAIQWSGTPPAPVAALSSWLDTWNGLGLVAVGMHRQGYDTSLTQYDDRGWRATFYVTGMEHSLTRWTGSAWEATPWRAVQRAAWQALARDPEGHG